MISFVLVSLPPKLSDQPASIYVGICNIDVHVLFLPYTKYFVSICVVTCKLDSLCCYTIVASSMCNVSISTELCFH